MRNVVLSGGILILAISVFGCVEAESAEPSLDSILGPRLSASWTSAWH